MASFRAAAPILSRQLRIMGRLSYETGRFDRNVEARDPEAPMQTHTEDSWLLDVVLSGSEANGRFGYSLGVYNALDADAGQPVSSEFRQLSIPITGRSLLAAVNVSF